MKRYALTVPRTRLACAAKLERLYLDVISAVDTEVGAQWLLPVAYYRASSCAQTALRKAQAGGADEHVVQTWRPSPYNLDM